MTRLSGTIRAGGERIVCEVTAHRRRTGKINLLVVDKDGYTLTLTLRNHEVARDLYRELGDALDEIAPR